MDKANVTNVVIAGLGGQGVITASDILADTAFRAGYDVRKAEVHGMSQRGGSVASDVRYGKNVLSPMIPRGEADVVVVLQEDEAPNHRDTLRPGAPMILPSDIDASKLANKRLLNVALLGRLSTRLDLPEDLWKAALLAAFKEQFHADNLAAFALGRGAG